MKNAFLFLMIFTMTSLLSCIYKDVEIVKLENVFVKKLSSKGISAEVFLKVKNPNNYNITITGSDLDIYVNGKSVGKATISDKVVFPKKSEKVHRFLIDSDFEKIGSGVIATIASVLMSQSVQLGLKGDVTAKAFLVQKKIKVEVNEKVNFTP